ncbi:MAG: PAS domain S-box protein, partial [Oxalobacteraceae bacterium]
MRTEDAIATGSHTVRSLWDALDKTHGITQFDASGIVLEVNQTMLGWLGCSAQEIVGTSFANLQLDHTEALSWSTIVAGEQSLRRERRTARDGGFLWLQSSYSPVLDSDGAVCRIIQIATNVSQDAQRELRAQGQLSAIRNSHALITFDIHGIILDANDIFLDTMGYT